MALFIININAQNNKMEKKPIKQTAGRQALGDFAAKSVENVYCSCSLEANIGLPIISAPCVISVQAISISIGEINLFFDITPEKYFISPNL